MVRDEFLNFGGRARLVLRGSLRISSRVRRTPKSCMPTASPSGKMRFRFSRVTSRAPGIRVAIRRPCSKGTTRSPRQAMTRSGDGDLGRQCGRSISRFAVRNAAASLPSSISVHFRGGDEDRTGSHPARTMRPTSGGRPSVGAPVAACERDHRIPSQDLLGRLRPVQERA